MKLKKTLLLTVLAVFLTISVLVFSVFAEESPYEGSDLPVSESYVLRAIGALEERVYTKIDTMIEAITARLDELQTKLDAVQSTPPQTDDTQASVPAEPQPAETEAVQTTPAPNMDYTVVYVTKGQSVVGSCEIILRSGKAIALCPGANGISDLTAGADLADGTEISANHLLLVPRNDGRGITVTSADAYVMVRGTYTVADPAGK